MQTLAERLQRALAERPGASQADLARHCRAKGPSVSAWFTGDTKSLKANTLLLAAEYLGVRPRWLLDGNGPMRDKDGTQLPTQPLDLAQALEVLGIELAKSLPDDVRQDVADQLHKLAMRRGAERDQQQVLALLTAPPGKQRQTGT